MVEIICKNSVLRTSWSERYQPVIDGRKRDITNVLVGYRIRPNEAEEDADDERRPR